MVDRIGVVRVILRHEISLLVRSDQPDFQPLAGNGVGDQRSIAVRLLCEHLGADALQRPDSHGVGQSCPLYDGMKNRGGQTGELLLQPLKHLFI